MIKCSMCRGSGWYQQRTDSRIKCPSCSGAGVINEKDPRQQKRAKDIEAYYANLNNFGFDGNYNASEVGRILDEKALESSAMRMTFPTESSKSQQPKPGVNRPTAEVNLGSTMATNAKQRSNESMENEDTRARRNQDMILTLNEYALIRDDTKGEVSIYVGPNKTSLAGSDCPVVLDTRTNRFRAVGLEAAIQSNVTAPEGSYIVLENPAESDKHPTGQGKVGTIPLRTGKKVNISGPTTFALWPGQIAKVLPGHNLRSNEYLLCRVYDEAAAKDNWSKAVIKTQTDTTDATETRTARSSATGSDIPAVSNLTMGKLFIVKGTEVSFYIPPTGIEVVPEVVSGEERYVREAVTLERLEYCLLLDQNGTKRYVRGPAVVFPQPTEKFVEAPIKSNPEKVKAKKFRAQELTPTSGIHIRVIADHTEDDGTERKAGDELFVTGVEQPVYFPREEHAIIKYGEQDVHYGIAIPPGEARYVLDRLKGTISLVRGPQVFLPDPRNQVIAQRALPLDLVALLYPGNNEALEINAARLGIEDQDVYGAAGANAAYLNSSYQRSSEDENYGATAAVAPGATGGRGIMIKSASKSLPGDAFDRKAKFTAPRSVILNTKYDGAVGVNLWTGYAMLLVSKSGSRQVIQGPGTFIFEYDEIPQVLTLSTGKPKNMDAPRKDVYLKTTANMVSDVIEVETKDFCKIKVKVVYRVNFEGTDATKWFSVDNYVKFLCDAMRSRIRNAVQKLGVEEFYGNHSPILRDIILGASPGEGKPRSGTLFTENNMRIYEAEVLGIEMTNREVETMLVNSQRSVIQNTLNLADARRKLVFETEVESLKRQGEQAKADTERAAFELRAETAKRKLALDLTLIANNAKQQAESLAAEAAADNQRASNNLAREKANADTAAIQLEVESERRAAERSHQESLQVIELQKLQAQVQATVDKAKAIDPAFVAALQAFGDKELVQKLCEAMAPLAIIGGGKKGVAEIFNEMLKGTTLGNTLSSLTSGAEKAAQANGKAARA